MGIRGHADQLRGKYVTALISDSNHRAHAVPIKKMIGDYFLAAVNGQLYAFSHEGRADFDDGGLGEQAGAVRAV